MKEEILKKQTEKMKEVCLGLSRFTI